MAHPWFWALRVSIRPHARLRIAATRAAAFGGEGNSGLTIGEIPTLLLGLGGGAHGETENQVASVEARWRPPLASLPLLLYGEWGFDDMGLSYFHVPGVIAGARIAAVPGAPALALGLQYTGFARHCCGNPPWYRHSALPWMDERAPLGNPLGGNGTEWRLYGDADLAAATLRVDAVVFRRRRGPENLYAPVHEGRSLGGEAGVAWRPGRDLEAYARYRGERGAGWSAASAEVGLRLHP